MHEASFPTVAGHLAAAAAYQSTLDRPDLPPVRFARLDWDQDTATVQASACLAVAGGPWATDQDAQIDGNHRLAVAPQAGVRKVPVRFECKRGLRDSREE